MGAMTVEKFYRLWVYETRGFWLFKRTVSKPVSVVAVPAEWTRHDVIDGLLDGADIRQIEPPEEIPAGAVVQDLLLA